MNNQPLPNISSNKLQQEPIEQAKTILSSGYYSDIIFEFGKEAIFSHFWQLDCHENELTNTGDALLLEFADRPLLLRKSDEININAFCNICKHRGVPVAVKKGTTSVLQCRSCVDTYLLDRSLRGVLQFHEDIEYGDQFRMRISKYVSSSRKDYGQKFYDKERFSAERK